MIRTLQYIILIVSLFSCNRKKATPVDVKVAEIGYKVLLKDDVEGIGAGAETTEDSLQLVRAFVNNWLRNNALLLEAEQSNTDADKISKLVDEYRNSLLVYEYESKIVSESLDTLVTKEQIKDYYNEYGDQFLLPTKILKYWIAVIPAKAKRIDKFFTDWKRGDSLKVLKYCNEQADFFEFRSYDWRTESELNSFLPVGLFKSKKYIKGAVLQKHSSNREYFVKIIDAIKENEIPPVTYIESKIAKVILNNRKQELLNRIRENLFKKQLNANNVKLYINN